jgi:glycosyltransferase involved in cell wall biosynthesis
MKVLHIGWGFRPWREGGLIEYAEDLMNIQVDQGYEVAYFFSGRHYLFSRKPWLKQWLKNKIKMYEIINSPIYYAGEKGTKNSEIELNEEYSEKFFIEVLFKFNPDIIHIQELAGLPSSLIEIAVQKSIPMIMTLHDYYLLCPTLKLFDYNYSICLNSEIGDKCLICCAQAPRNLNHLLLRTLGFETKDKWILETILSTIVKLNKTRKYLLHNFLRKTVIQNNHYGVDQIDKKAAEEFQSRRIVNIERLNKVDLLVSQSFKVAEIYKILGCQEHKLITIHSTVKHIDNIKPKNIESITEPINFVTMNGCASIQKGADLIVGALRKLKAIGLTNNFRLFVMGGMLERTKDELLQFDNIVFKGHYAVTDIDSLLEEMHVGIVPSVWEEVYGYVGIEFLAKGIPVIGNNVGGITDYTIDNFTGWVNKANTAQGLAEIMANIIENPNQIVDLNKNIFSNYRQIIKPMTLHFKEIEQTYKDLIQPKN